MEQHGAAMINRLPLTVGFARVSQATEDQGNLETQTRQLQDYGVHELVTEIGSGARSDRQALRNLRDRLQAGDTLVVTAIDRISRRAVDGLRFIRDVTDAGIHLVVLSQREFDTTTPTGQLLLHLTLAIAEWEWSNIRDRSIQGQQRARAEGKRIGRPPVLTPQETVEVREKILAGLSVTRIAREHRVHHSVVRRVAQELEARETLR
jgi:putative DNA-invertase from lambdoid prophage Rac